MNGSRISGFVFAITIIVLAAMLMAHLGFFGRAETRSNGVVIPTLSGEALAGQAVFEANCASCHGTNGVGTNKGPPLVHDIYNPGHHSDAAFHRAVRDGVPQHHWPFGNMPAQTQVSEEQVGKILKFVRELQVANGIRYRPHRM